MPEGEENSKQSENSGKVFGGLVGAVAKTDQRASLLAQCECTNRTVIRDVCIPTEHKSRAQR